MDKKKNISKETKTKLTEVLGEAILVLLSSNAHRMSFFINDIEWLLMPPLASEQFRLYKDKEGKPVGLILWAYVSDEIDKKLENGIGKLGLNDWNSGETLWIFDIVAPKGGATKMLDELKSTALKGKRIKYQSIDKDGNRKILTTLGK